MNPFPKRLFANISNVCNSLLFTRQRLTFRQTKQMVTISKQKLTLQ